MSITVSRHGLWGRPYGNFALKTGGGGPVTGEVEIVGTTIGTTAAAGSSLANVDDEDFATFYESDSVDGWVGKDLGVGETGVVTRLRLAPRRGDATLVPGTDDESLYESAVVNMKVQSSDDPTFATGVTDELTIPAFPALHSNRYTEFLITGGRSRRCWRVLPAPGTKCHVSNLVWICEQGPPSVRPVRPKPFPNGGRFPFPEYPPSVTIANLTSSGTSYYTEDGVTDPDNTDTPYTLAIAPDMSGGPAVLKLVTYEPSLANPYSVVVTSRPFNPWGFKAGSRWYDTNGDLLSLHCGEWLTGPGGDILLVSGRAIWIGTSCDRYSDVSPAGDGFDANGKTGVWAARSANLFPNDYYNWEPQINILPVLPSWTYYIRPHAKFHEGSSEFKLWLHAYRSARDNDRYLVFSGTDILGTTWTDVHPGGYLMHGTTIGWDANLFLDEDGTCYRIWVQQFGTQINISQLNSDFDATTGSPVNLSVGTSRESPVMATLANGKADLIHSKAIYYDSAGSTSFDLEHQTANTTPMGTYSSPVDVMPSNPVGTNFNVQSTALIRFPGDTLVLMSDYWNFDQMDQSFPSFDRYDGLTLGFEDEWDLSDLVVHKVFSDTLTLSLNEVFTSYAVGDALVDLFTGTAGTLISAHISDSNHQWRIITTQNQLLLSGTGSIYSTHSGGTSITALSNRTPVSVNQFVELIHKEHSHLNQGYAGLLRASTPTNSYIDLSGYDAFRVENSITIGKWVNGSYSVLSTVNTGIPGFSEGDVTSFEVRGSNPTQLDVKVNGVTYVSYSDSSSPITALGNPGIRYYSDEAGTPTTGHHIDSVASGDITSKTVSDILTLSITDSYSVSIIGGMVSKTFSDTLTVGITDTYTVVHYAYKTFTDLITLSVTDTLNVELATDLDYISVRAILGVGDITIQDVGRTSIQDAW